METSKTVTVTMDRQDYYEVCNLLQLMVVLDVKLYMMGMPGPDKVKLSRVFDAMVKAGTPVLMNTEPEVAQ